MASLRYGFLSEQWADQTNIKISKIYKIRSQNKKIL
jgi:hypothetical protein